MLPETLGFGGWADDLIASATRDAFYGGVSMRAVMQDKRTGEMFEVERVAVAVAKATADVVDSEGVPRYGRLLLATTTARR